MPAARRLTLGAALLGLLALVAVSPDAAASVEGTVGFDLVALDEAEIEATVNLTGEQAREIRELADHDDDGEVSALEAAGARTVIDDRLQGPTEAYTLDGNGYENTQASVSTEGLKGPVDRDATVTVDISLEAETQAGAQAPHTFAVHGLPGNLTEDASLALAVQAPEGFVIAEADGLEPADECRATSSSSTGEARVRLVPEDEACPRPVPGPGLGLALAGLAIVVLARRRRLRH